MATAFSRNRDDFYQTNVNVNKLQKLFKDFKIDEEVCKVYLIFSCMNFVLCNVITFYNHKIVKILDFYYIFILAVGKICSCQ